MLTKKEPSKNEAKTKSPQQTTLRTLTTQAKKTTPSAPAKQPLATKPNESKKSQLKTRITVKYDTGFKNHLYIRGKGANLNWEKGEVLRNVKADEWVWETDANFSHCEFKILLNDCDYETGNNHYLNQGATITYTPRF
jgi:hypothetical protein